MEVQVLFDWLDKGALVVMAAGFLWLIKVNVNDSHHVLKCMDRKLTEIVDLLRRLNEASK